LSLQFIAFSTLLKNTVRLFNLALNQKFITFLLQKKSQVTSFVPLIEWHFGQVLCVLLIGAGFGYASLCSKFSSEE